MSINSNFDADLIKKRMKAIHFGSQVVVASLIFMAGVICWIVIEFLFMPHTLVEHDFASLVATPFNFSINDEVFAALETRREYTSATSPAEATLSGRTYELNDFPIYILDQEASKRDRALVIVDKNTLRQLDAPDISPGDAIATPVFTTDTPAPTSSDDVVEVTTTN